MCIVHATSSCLSELHVFMPLKLQMVYCSMNVDISFNYMNILQFLFCSIIHESIQWVYRIRIVIVQYQGWWH